MCTESWGTNTVNQLGNTASDDVNRAAEYPIYVHKATNGTCYPCRGNGSSEINTILGRMLNAVELVKW